MFADRPRSTWWWYRRFRKAYAKHGVTIKSRRSTWADAKYSRRAMPAAEQRKLRPL